MWGSPVTAGSPSDRGAVHDGDEKSPPRRLSLNLPVGGLPARALGLLYLAGATIGLVSLVLPHPPQASIGGLYSNVALAYLGAAVLLAGASRMRVWMLHLAVIAGSLIITRAILLSGQTVSFYSVWYIWVGLFAFYFFSRPGAAAHVSFVALLYGLTLINHPPTWAFARWLTTIATLMVAGLFIDTLLRRARGQASAAAASASSMARVAAVAHELAGMTDSNAGRRTLCDGAVQVTQARQAKLWEVELQGGDLQLTASSGQAPPTSWEARVPAGATEAFRTGRPVVAPQPGSQDGARGERPIRAWEPVLKEGEPVAVLELAWDSGEVLTDASTEALLHLLAVEVAVTLQRLGLLAELEKKARTDELTGLSNRRWWHEQLPRELARSARTQHPLCVAIIDLDHFKRYNDTYGHQTGDGLLCTVAAGWLKELRPGDMLARHGGEEFVLALPECPLEEALMVVERLRAVMPRGESCSAGIACWDGAESVTDLLARADHALYGAKRNGRDQSALAEVGTLELAADSLGVHDRRA
jgi:diguanylate cyclase (GGDEF)-like protein